MPDDSRHQVNLLDLLAFLLRWRRFILICVFSVTAAVAIIVLVLPPRYRSVALVRSQESSGENVGSLIASKLGSLGGLANMASSLGGEVAEELYISILQSRWMSERVIERFNLRSVYRMEDDRIEDIIELLLARTDFELDELSSNISIQVEDKDPNRARDMADFYVDELDTRNQELKSLAARKEREFIGARLDEERLRLESLEDSLYHFQISTGVLDIEEQAKATIQAAAALQAQKMIARAEMEMHRQTLGTRNPETEFSRIKIASIDSSLRMLTRGTESSEDQEFLLGLGEIPSKGMTYLRFVRDIEIEQILVAFLLQQHEQAKIAEKRNTPTLMRIDPPLAATKRAWPRRSLMVGVALFGAFVFATAFAFVYETLTNAFRDPLHPQHRHILKVIESLRTKRV